MYEVPEGAEVTRIDFLLSSHHKVVDLACGASWLLEKIFVLCLFYGEENWLGNRLIQ